MKIVQILLMLVFVVVAGGQATAAEPPPRAGAPWVWPVAGTIMITSAYEQPADSYAPGHRGIDVRAAQGSSVRSPRDGVVAFVGTVVDRPLITIDHGGGYVSTLEPVRSDLSVGDAVARGDPVGVVSSGGHTAAGSVHWGVRLRGEYINPATLLGGVAKPILLPGC